MPKSLFKISLTTISLKRYSKKNLGIKVIHEFYAHKFYNFSKIKKLRKIKLFKKGKLPGWRSLARKPASARSQIRISPTRKPPPLSFLRLFIG